MANEIEDEQARQAREARLRGLPVPPPPRAQQVADMTTESGRGVKPLSSAGHAFSSPAGIGAYTGGVSRTQGSNLAVPPPGQPGSVFTPTVRGRDGKTVEPAPKRELPIHTEGLIDSRDIPVDRVAQNAAKTAVRSAAHSLDASKVIDSKDIPGPLPATAPGAASTAASMVPDAPIDGESVVKASTQGFVNGFTGGMANQMGPSPLGALAVVAEAAEENLTAPAAPSAAVAARMEKFPELRGVEVPTGNAAKFPELAPAPVDERRGGGAQQDGAETDEGWGR